MFRVTAVDRESSNDAGNGCPKDSGIRRRATNETINGKRRRLSGEDVCALPALKVTKVRRSCVGQTSAPVAAKTGTNGSKTVTNHKVHQSPSRVNGGESCLDVPAAGTVSSEITSCSQRIMTRSYTAAGLAATGDMKVAQMATQGARSQPRQTQLLLGKHHVSQQERILAAVGAVRRGRAGIRRGVTTAVETNGTRGSSFSILSSQGSASQTQSLLVFPSVTGASRTRQTQNAASQQQQRQRKLTLVKSSSMLLSLEKLSQSLTHSSEQAGEKRPGSLRENDNAAGSLVPRSQGQGTVGNRRSRFSKFSTVDKIQSSSQPSVVETGNLSRRVLRGIKPSDHPGADHVSGMAVACLQGVNQHGGKLTVDGSKAFKALSPAVTDKRKSIDEVKGQLGRLETSRIKKTCSELTEPKNENKPLALGAANMSIAHSTATKDVPLGDTEIADVPMKIASSIDVSRRALQSSASVSNLNVQGNDAKTHLRKAPLQNSHSVFSGQESDRDSSNLVVGHFKNKMVCSATSACTLVTPSTTAPAPSTGNVQCSSVDFLTNGGATFPSGSLAHQAADRAGVTPSGVPFMLDNATSEADGLMCDVDVSDGKEVHLPCAGKVLTASFRHISPVAMRDPFNSWIAIAADRRALDAENYTTSLRADVAAYGQSWFVHHKRSESQFEPWQMSMTGKIEKLRLGVIAMYWNSATLHPISPATIYVAINNFGRLLNQWNKTELEHPSAARWALAAVIAFRLAFKTEERPEVVYDVTNLWSLFPMFSDWEIDQSEENMNKTELEALHILGDSMDVPLSPMFLSLYITAGGWPEEVARDYRELALYLLALTTFSSAKDQLLRNIPPSRLAAAALVLAVKIINGDRACPHGILHHMKLCPFPTVLAQKGPDSCTIGDAIQHCVCRYEFFPERLRVFSGFAFEDLSPIIRGLSSLLRSKPSETCVLSSFYPLWANNDWQ